jgi:hypothetical protein
LVGVGRIAELDKNQYFVGVWSIRRDPCKEGQREYAWRKTSSGEGMLEVVVCDGKGFIDGSR